MNFYAFYYHGLDRVVTTLFLDSDKRTYNPATEEGVSQRL